MWNLCACEDANQLPRCLECSEANNWFTPQGTQGPASSKALNLTLH